MDDIDRQIVAFLIDPMKRELSITDTQIGLLGIYGDGHKVKGALLGSRVWWVAPDYPRANIGWKLAKRLIGGLPKSLYKISEQDRTIEFPMTGGWIQVKSGFDPDSFTSSTLVSA